MKTNCKKCGVAFSFSPSQKRQYCSWGCAFTSDERNNKLKLKTTYIEWTCKGCGKMERLAKAKTSRKSFCSSKCRESGYLKNIINICPECKKEFNNRNGRRKQTYCSNPCKFKALGKLPKTEESIIKATKTRRANGVYSSSNMYSRCKDGRRDDLNGIYFRSRWEANYARYLNFLIKKGNIKKWEYESYTFWFDGIRRGVVSYKPDFKIINNNGIHEWHEIKGYLDAKSKTKLKRMSKYYPGERLILIGQKEYKSISQYAALIPNWETDERGR